MIYIFKKIYQPIKQSFLSVEYLLVRDGLIYLSIFSLKDRPPLRRYLMDGDFFTGASLATSLTKLALRYCDAVLLKK